MRAYDFVIAGGGLAGLSLACHIVRSPLCGASMLIVDRNAAAIMGRSWSYWTQQPTPFDPIVAHAWNALHIAGPAGEKTLNLPGWRYELVRGADLATFARHELGLHAHVDFQQGSIERVEDGAQGAHVFVDGDPIAAGWVFDSTHWPPPALRPAGSVAMYFKAWTVQTHKPAFNPRAVTFLDSRTVQQADLRFFYVLPFSEREALVAYVAYSRQRPLASAADAALQTYLHTTLGIAEDDVQAEETSCLPIITTQHSRRLGPHRLAIGARAGLIKPTTGFAFRRIQQDSAAIVRSLLTTRKPWNIPAVSRRHRLYDALLMYVLEHRGAEIRGVFEALFARNPIETVLRFLDETTAANEELGIISTLPTRPFLKAVPGFTAGSLRRAQPWF